VAQARSGAGSYFSYAFVFDLFPWCAAFINSSLLLFTRSGAVASPYQAGAD
jgi:hypothetical protein